jgi:hypothetical protein
MAELRFWSITKNASIPAKPGRPFAVFTIISWVRRKRALFRLIFPFSKTERRGCQKWFSSLFPKTPSHSYNLKIEEISTNHKRRLSYFCDAAKKRKSNVFECSASFTPCDPKRMGFSRDFLIKQSASLVGRVGEISGESQGSYGDWV